jgi:hypothetical protein
MTIRIDVNEVFDPQGNLLFSEQVEVEIPDNPMTEVVAGLTELQKTALLAALQA